MARYEENVGTLDDFRQANYASSRRGLYATDQDTLRASTIRTRPTGVFVGGQQQITDRPMANAGTTRYGVPPPAPIRDPRISELSVGGRSIVAPGSNASLADAQARFRAGQVAPPPRDNAPLTVGGRIGVPGVRAPIAAPGVQAPAQPPVTTPERQSAWDNRLAAPQGETRTQASRRLGISAGSGALDKKLAREEQDRRQSEYLAQQRKDYLNQGVAAQQEQTRRQAAMDVAAGERNDATVAGRTAVAQTRYEGIVYGADARKAIGFDTNKTLAENTRANNIAKDVALGKTTEAATALENQRADNRITQLKTMRDTATTLQEMRDATSLLEQEQETLRASLPVTLTRGEAIINPETGKLTGETKTTTQTRVTGEAPAATAQPEASAKPSQSAGDINQDGTVDDNESEYNRAIAIKERAYEQMTPAKKLFLDNRIKELKAKLLPSV